MDDVRESDPSAGGPENLRGDMGISSERTGPAGKDPAGDGIEGTGSHGSATTDPVGLQETSRTSEAHGPEMDDTQQEATQEWRDTQPPVDRDGEIDRTVGESNTADVPSQPFDPTRNPGHSHG